MEKMDSDLCWGIILIAVILFIVGSILILFPSSKDFFAVLAPIMIGLGGAYRVLDKDNDDVNEENNKCRNCGHELMMMPTSVPFAELKGYDFA